MKPGTRIEIGYYAKTTATGAQVNEGKIVDVYVGWWQGMSDGGREAWADYPRLYKSIEDLKAIIPYLSRSMWGFKDVDVDNVKFFRRTTQTIVVDDEIKEGMDDMS